MIMKHYLTIDQYLEYLKYDLNCSFSLNKAMEPFGLQLDVDDEWEEDVLFGIFVDELNDRLQNSSMIDPFDVAIIAQDLGVYGAKEFIIEYSQQIEKIKLSHE